LVVLHGDEDAALRLRERSLPMRQKKALVKFIEELKVVSQQDFEDIARIYRTYSPAEITLANLRAAVSEHCVLVSRSSESGAHIIGFVTLVIYRRMKGSVAQIEDIVVDKRYHRRGLGMKLLAECVERASKAQCADVHLMTYPHLKPANRLYQKTGWIKLDTNTYRKHL
jgi:ribosomal protein S18 acetylase RimI-like enzyme